MLTLDDFSTQILRPSVLRHILDGTLDGVLFDPDVIPTWIDGDELVAAALQRITVMLQATVEHH